MDKHEEFRVWAEERGVKINGISAHKWDGRGVGIRAERDIKPGEIVLKVPATALRHAKTVPQATIRRLPQITIHGLLATDLVLSKPTSLAPWNSVLPTLGDFQETHPMTWDAALQALLPPEAASLLSNQYRKFDLDWGMVSEVYPEIQKEDYHYAWLIVNTRTFFWTFPNARKKLKTDDCMVLSPFADYLNHAAEGCVVKFDASGFTICSDRVYVAGEEVYISYGRHSNDFLLAEYGFIMSENLWDCVSLDEPILASLSKDQKIRLKEEGFLGDYVLDGDGVCYRTQVAVRIGSVSENRWRRFVEGMDEGEADQERVDGVLRRLIGDYVATAKEKVEELRREEAGLAEQRLTLERRWLQIIRALEAELERLE